jgi:hypothetical protein
MLGIVIAVWLGLTIANFTWQLVHEENWAIAFKESFDQAVAIGIFLMVLLLSQKT